MDYQVSELAKKLPATPDSFQCIEQINALPQDEKFKFFQNLSIAKIKSPAIALILGIFLTGFAADRFYIGSYVIGAIRLALFVCGLVFGVGEIFEPLKLLVTAAIIWGIVDLFLCRKEVKASNLDKVKSCLNYAKGQ